MRSLIVLALLGASVTASNAQYYPQFAQRYYNSHAPRYYQNPYRSYGGDRGYRGGYVAPRPSYRYDWSWGGGNRGYLGGRGGGWGGEW